MSSKSDALGDIDRALKYRPRSPSNGHANDHELFRVFAACVDRWAPPKSTYSRGIRDLEDKGNIAWAHQARAILQALRADIEADALKTFEELVHANLFSDFLAQASHLNGLGYRRPAAVLCGGVLEEHLRQLAARHGLPTSTAHGAPAQASALNSSLYSAASAYSKAEHAQVDAWQKVRNDAAHGSTSFEADYDTAEIRRMVDGVRAFVDKHPA